MFKLYFVFGFGGSNGHVTIAIFAFFKLFNICECENSLSIRIPSIRDVSFSDFPGFPIIFIKSKFTSFLS